MKYSGSILYDKELRNTEHSLVIWGVGKYGKKIYEFLKVNDLLDKLECFCDNNAELWNEKYEGIPILSPENAVKTSEQREFLIGGQYAFEMLDYLIDHEIENIHLLFF